jgi:hypothetical protein
MPLLHKQSVLESFSWNGTDYTTNQAGTRILQNGCTADQVLNLTVTPKPADAVTTQTICSRSFSGMVLIIQLIKLVQESSKRMYCWSSTERLYPKPADAVTTQTICSGESFSWNGTDYTTTQAGTRILQNGCTADQVLNLTVTPKPADAVTTQTICLESLSLGMVLIIQLNKNPSKQCTADQVLNLTVTPNQPAVTTNNLFWKSFSWNGTDYTYSSWYKNPSKRMYCWSSIELDCNLNQRMPLLHKQSVLESLSLGMVLIIQVLKLVQESLKRCTADQVLNLTVTLNQRMPLLHKQSVLEVSFSWNGTDYTTTRWYKNR